MSEKVKKSILDMAMGGIKERVDLEIGKVLDNIHDVNTVASKKRTISLQIELLPDDERKMIRVEVTAKSKLQPTTPIAMALYLMPDENGELQAYEATPVMPGQMDMFGKEQEEPAMLKIVK